MSNFENSNVAQAVAPATETSHPGMMAPELVAAQALAHPDALAMQARGVAITYGELQQRSTALAAHLRSLGVGPEVLVGLCIPRSIALVVGALAILKAGGAYLPLDANYPAERISSLLNDAGVSIVLAPQCTQDQLPAGTWQVIGLGQEGQTSFEAAIADFPANRPEQLAYVIYTSGSTGQPKGVEITHGNLMNLVRWHQRAFAVTAKDRATLLASPAFDASVWEIWPYLTAGASLHVPDDCVRLVSESLRDWLVKERINIGFLPTALAEPMLDQRWPRDTALRYLLTGADTLRRRPTHPLPFQFINNYGPTECTVVSTSGAVLQQDQAATLPSIGTAIDGAYLRILDAELRPVLAGEPGELYIGGASVGRGYRNRPEQTAERFIADPMANSSNGTARLYRTGDLARENAAGEIEFLGRIDEQIKIRGHRIEPNEIVRVLDEHPLVASSAVVARDAGNGEKRLVAYIVQASNMDFSPRGLQEHLARRLPDYMIPAMFVRIDALPLTTNGKIDRAALPEPNETNTVQEETFVAPSTPVQEKLAAIAGELLSLERVGIHDNFFLLGGHSLLGTQLITRINQNFGVELPLREVFEAPTIEELAAVIEEKIFEKIASMPEEEVQRTLQGAQVG